LYSTSSSSHNPTNPIQAGAYNAKHALFFPRFFSLLLPTLFPFLAVSQSTPFFQAMNQPIDPFKIAGNVYYVGASGVASFLVTTTEGHILVDSGFERKPFPSSKKACRHWDSNWRISRFFCATTPTSITPVDWPPEE
jgi:hypothetical protein